VSGILNCVGGLGWLVAGLFMFLVGHHLHHRSGRPTCSSSGPRHHLCSNLMGASAASIRPARTWPSLNIVSFIFFNLIPACWASSTWWFYGDEETDGFSSRPTAPTDHEPEAVAMAAVGGLAHVAAADPQYWSLLIQAPARSTGRNPQPGPAKPPGRFRLPYHVS